MVLCSLPKEMGIFQYTLGTRLPGEFRDDSSSPVSQRSGFRNRVLSSSSGRLTRAKAIVHVLGRVFETLTNNWKENFPYIALGLWWLILIKMKLYFLFNQEKMINDNFGLLLKNYLIPETIYIFKKLKEKFKTLIHGTIYCFQT